MALQGCFGQQQRVDSAPQGNTVVLYFELKQIGVHRRQKLVGQWAGIWLMLGWLKLSDFKHDL